MREQIEMEEVFTENWEELIDEIMEDGLDLVWNEKIEKYEKKVMTKKHFEFIARTISRINRKSERCMIAMDTASELKKENPLFNENIFIKACECWRDD